MTYWPMHVIFTTGRISHTRLGGWEICIFFNLANFDTPHHLHFWQNYDPGLGARPHGLPSRSARSGYKTATNKTTTVTKPRHYKTATTTKPRHYKTATITKPRQLQNRDNYKTATLQNRECYKTATLQKTNIQKVLMLEGHGRSTRPPCL